MNVLTSLCAYYTPDEVAQLVAQAIRESNPNAILDPAAGDGALLLAAMERFPNADTMAIDIDKSAILRLRKILPNCTVSSCNALDRRSITRSKVWRLKSCVDVVVANPPFGALGTPRLTVVAAWGETVRCGTGAAHILSATVGFAPKQLVAVVPDSMLHSERDARAVDLIESRYSLAVVKALGSGAFGNAGASVSLIELVRRPSPTPQRELARTDDCFDVGTGPVLLTRGGLPMHDIKPMDSSRGIPLLHTTSLRGRGPSKFVRPLRRGVVCGPMILLPRVGLPQQRHLLPVNLRRTHQLSDCVLALSCPSDVVASSVSRLLRERFHDLKACWGGTGAQYTTMNKLRDCLTKIGVAVEIDQSCETHVLSAGRRMVNGNGRDKARSETPRLA